MQQNSSSESKSETRNIFSSFSALRPDLLGVIFHLSWLYLLLYRSPSSPITLTGSNIGINDPVYLSSVLALIITLLVGSLRTKTFMRIGETRVLAFIAPVLTSLGTLLYCINVFVPLLPLIIFGGILTGIGSAILTARWASIFGNTSSKIILANFSVILMVIVAICLSVEYVPSEISFILLVTLPLFSGVALQFARKYQRGMASERTSRLNKHTDSRRGKTYAVLIALIALFGLTTGCLTTFSYNHSAAIENYVFLFYLFTCIAAWFFVGGSLFLNDRPALIPLFIIPVAVLIFLMLPFMKFSTESFSDAFFPVGNIVFELMLLFGTVLFALVRDLSPAKTFMTGRLVLAVSDLAGAYIGEIVSGLGDATISIQVASISLFGGAELLIIAFAITYLTDKRNRIKQGEAEIASCSPEAKVSVSGASEGLNDAFDQQIQKIGNHYDLSDRELDVFSLLAKGRSAARIEGDLHIARGTVNFHTRNIYQKLSIHSRQDLIDIVQKDAS